MFLKNKELYKQRRKWPANNGKMGWKKKKDSPQAKQKQLVNVGKHGLTSHNKKYELNLHH